MKVQVTLYKDGGTRIDRQIVEVNDEQWEEMDFLDKEEACINLTRRSYYWHWRELTKDEA